MTVGGGVDQTHAAAFEAYRQALVTGRLPEAMALDRVAGRRVRDWEHACGERPLSDEAVDVGLALLDLEDGRCDLLELTTHESSPRHPRDGVGRRFEAGALVAAPAWTAAWSYRRAASPAPDALSGVAVVERVVVGLHRHPTLWRLTRDHAPRQGGEAAPAFVADRVPVVTSPRLPGAPP